MPHKSLDFQVELNQWLKCQEILRRPFYDRPVKQAREIQLFLSCILAGLSYLLDIGYLLDV